MSVPDETREKLAEHLSEFKEVLEQTLDKIAREEIDGWLRVGPDAMMHSLDALVEKRRERADNFKKRVIDAPTGEAYLDEAESLYDEAMAVRLRMLWFTLVEAIGKTYGADARLIDVLADLSV